MARETDMRIERILVALGATPPEETALETAGALASALDAELAGVYVEDTNLVRIAGFPFTRELGNTSAVPRSMTTADLERALRMQAARHRARLEALATGLNLRWSFHVVRGRAFSAVLERTSEADVIVFGKAPHGMTAQPATLAALGRALAHERRNQDERFHRLSLRSIVLPFDGTRQGWRALAAAYAVAAIASTRLSILIVAQSEEEFERQRAAARAWLSERDATARFSWLQSSVVSDIVALTAAQDPAALFWYEPAFDPERLDALLGALRCPLVYIQ